MVGPKFFMLKYRYKFQACRTIRRCIWIAVLQVIENNKSLAHETAVLSMRAQNVMGKSQRDVL